MGANTVSVEQDSEYAGLVHKAVNLFTFLGRAQQLLVKPIRTVDKFEKVMWFGDLPDHPGVHSAHRIAELEADAPLLAVDRVPKLDPPPVSPQLEPWVDGPTGDIDRQPELRDAIYTSDPARAGGDEVGEFGDEPADGRRQEAADVPGLEAAFDHWVADWRLWAERERRDAAVRDIYRDLFEVQLNSTDHSEEFELVVGVGCLSWRPDDHDQILRHVVIAPISIELDESSGTLTVARGSSPEAVSIELDMLDPAVISSPAKVDEIRQMAGEYDGHMLDESAIGDICRRLIHRLDPDAEYDDDIAPPTGTSPRGAFAPAIILRRRTNRGLVQIYHDIVTQIQATGAIPSGVMPLIDPNRQPESEPSTSAGAVVRIDDEDFLPLPVNDAQRRIIERVDSTAQTVVQGPPGTGKTHTAAALVSHLLAQGKRVLITAHTDRALREVRGKLPREIQSLAVSVIGQSRSDMAELRTAVENISRRADEFEPSESQMSIDRHLTELDQLRRHRAAAHARLLTIRQQEVEPRDDGPEHGTLAAIAYRHLQDEPRFEWIRDFDITSAQTPQITAEDILSWRNALLDDDLINHEVEASGRLADLATVAAPADFANLTAAEKVALANKDKYASLLAHDSFGFVRSLPTEVRDELRTRVSDLAERAMALERREETWMNEALHDVRSDRHQTWLARSAQVKRLADTAESHVERMGHTTSVVVTDGDLGVHQHIAKSLLTHIESGDKIKTLPDGSPKVGTFTSKTVKLAAPFFSSVKVNGVPAITSEQLAAFIDWADATRTISALDQAWPVSVKIPDEDTLSAKLQWHRTEVAQLDKVLALGDQLELERSWFHANKLPTPDWNNLDDIRRYAALVDAAAAADNAAMATSPLAALDSYLRAEAQWPNAPAATRMLLSAVENRDLDAYVSAHGHLVHLHEVAEAVSDRDRVRAELNRIAPRLAEAIAADPAAAEWDDRLPSFDDAWRWLATGRWILEQDSEDSNVLKTQLNAIERRIRSEVEHLAAERSWSHAVAPGRLTGSARANLTQYAQLVSSLGKGTGKYAAKRRVEIAEAMDRCRPSVPVWIMPIYRIAEQVRIHPNLYDVVIVDEASQAGLEAVFLQYLAPKIVVIGDDKQVSPSAVGVDQQQLRDLASQYLATDSYRASWLDPKRSYFDEAAMRFGGRITLTEHRRCVPEIIGFSNRIAYEPEGIRLIPVRQFGAERLEPIKVVHVADGYEGTNRTNPVEADAIVDQIRKCMVEPQYDGATFGVISLLGKEQAKLIERKLLDVVAPEEWSARELRCGDASDFQGSERNVMFLSMVKTQDPNRRISALTADQYIQRFNVAASRAKDQMWVYHSVSKADLTNAEDMRFQLLDYCYGVANRTHSDVQGSVDGVVPEDLLVPPFDSLFEQRTFNRIVDRGYTVVPQYPAIGYHIDLVIIGAKGRLAVECDGDFWHGPAEFESDLARQRELERCGWEFFRVRESVFYADMPGTLRKLWETLDELDIRTADWIDPSFTTDSASDNEDDIDESVVEDLLSEADDTEPEWDGPPTDFEPSAERVSPAPQQTSTPMGGRHRADEPEDSLVDQLEDADAGRAFVDGRHNADMRDMNVHRREHPNAEAPVLGVVRARIAPGLQPYTLFDEPLAALGEGGLSAITANVVRIVAVEGPVLGYRLQQAYVKASGGQKVGKGIARVLNQAITGAERRGEIVSDNPLNESGVRPKTFRLPSQPPVIPRELGPRSLNLVPPAELAHHLAELSAGEEVRTEEELFRAALDRLGLQKLTENAKAVLARASEIVLAEESAPTDGAPV
jgi:very-short-patch-repair endonuclease